MPKILNSFISFESCPVCLSSNFRTFKRSTFDLLHLNKNQIKITDSDYGKIWDLSRCESCGHVFANPSPSPEFIQSLYSKIEDPLYEEEARGRARNFQKILSRLEKIHPDKGRLFDVGAATGILLSLAKKRGWHVEGVEPSTWAVKVAEKKYHIKINQGAFETLPLKSNYYTTVTMVDIIEHTPCAFEAVSKAHEILAPGGTLCMVTPDIQSLAARLMGSRWWHYRPAHLAYFSFGSLSRLLNRAGFRIIKVRKYSWTFSALYLLSRKPYFKFLIKSSFLASFWGKFSIKLALGDSFEVYAKK